MSRGLISIVVAVVCLVLLPGCVERRFRVESNPPGAMVFVNNVPHGPTPVDVPFVYYGVYNITLIKDGYDTQTFKQRVVAPWYAYPPVDFVAESIWPMQITDLRDLYYELTPTAPPNLNQIKQDAEDLRRRAAALPPPKYPDVKKKNATPFRDGEMLPETSPPQLAPPPRPAGGSSENAPILPNT
jgi:PEGA domain